MVDRILDTDSQNKSLMIHKYHSNHSNVFFVIYKKSLPIRQQSTVLPSRVENLSMVKGRGFSNPEGKDENAAWEVSN